MTIHVRMVVHVWKKGSRMCAIVRLNGLENRVPDVSSEVCFFVELV